MVFDFDTEDKHLAAGALLVYAVYRSRDRSKLKVTPDMWGRIERAVESCAKRAQDLGEFLQRLKPKLCCSSIKPKWTTTGLENVLILKRLPNDTYVSLEVPERRRFLTDVLREVDHEQVLECLRRKASWIVLLVRDRLEREKGLVKEEEETDEEDI